MKPITPGAHPNDKYPTTPGVCSNDPRYRRFQSGSFGSFGYAPGVIAFIRDHLVHVDALRVTFSSFARTPGVVVFICVLYVMRACMVVVDLIGGRLVHSGAPLGLSSRFGILIVHSSALLRSSGTFGFVWFIRARRGARPNERRKYSTTPAARPNEAKYTITIWARPNEPELTQHQPARTGIRNANLSDAVRE